MAKQPFRKTASSHAASLLALLENRYGAEPEFVPLPRIGGDAVFGMSRSFWYSVERAGLIELRRFRRPGCVKGRCMLPVPQARAALEAMSSGKHQTTRADARKSD